MANISLTEDFLKEIIFTNVGAGENEYWIKSIYREQPNVTEGVVVEVASYRGGGTSKLRFGKYDLTIEGPLTDHQEQIVQNYYQTLSNADPDFKKSYDAAQKILASKTEELKKLIFDRMLECLDQGQMIVEDSIKLSTGLEQGVWTNDDELVGHERIIKAVPNPLNTEDRKIKRGEIYYADLDPVYPQEIGGRRPVLIISIQDHLVSIAPMSTKTSYAERYSNMVKLKCDKYPQLPYVDQKEVIICTQAIRTINDERIFEKITALKEEDMQKVRTALIENLHVNEPLVEPEQSSTPLGTPKKISRIPDNGFDLSTNKLIEICNKKIECAKQNGSKLEYSAPKIERNADGLKGGHVARGTCIMRGKIEDRFDYAFTFKTFSVSVKRGNESNSDDNDLRRFLAKCMLEEYGDAYRISYARYWTTKFIHRVSTYGYKDDYAQKLNEHLKDVGLTCLKPAEVLQQEEDNYVYGQLSPLKITEAT